MDTSLPLGDVMGPEDNDADNREVCDDDDIYDPDDLGCDLSGLDVEALLLTQAELEEIDAEVAKAIQAGPPAPEVAETLRAKNMNVLSDILARSVKAAETTPAEALFVFMRFAVEYTIEVSRVHSANNATVFNNFKRMALDAAIEDRVTIQSGDNN
jgi:hypothetical protein